MYMARMEGVNSREGGVGMNPNRPEVLRHLQDFAASLRFLFCGKSLLAQQFPHQSQGIDFFLQAFQFGFFAA